MRNENCAALAGKPKLIFIQASRPSQASESGDTQFEAESDSCLEVPLKLPKAADFFVARGGAGRLTTPGYIQVIKNVFSESWKTMDVLTMMTRVSKRVEDGLTSIASRKHKHTPNITSTLTRDLFFSPPPSQPAPGEPEKYKMDSKNRGVAIIINNKHFGMDTRTGTDKDRDDMKKMLKAMKFDVRVYDDQRTEEMKRLLKDVSQEDHRDNDCFVCVILTHGENEGYIHGTNGRILLEELVLLFKDENCASLAEKPKLFFIQACRGGSTDDGMDVRMNTKKSGDKASGGDETASGQDAVDAEAAHGDCVKMISTGPHFLMAYAVTPGSLAFRNKVNGSWFIQSIKDTFAQNCQEMDLLTMMTRVNKCVAYDCQSASGKEEYNKKKAVSCFTSTLSKTVCFT